MPSQSPKAAFIPLLAAMLGLLGWLFLGRSCVDGTGGVGSGALGVPEVKPEEASSLPTVAPSEVEVMAAQKPLVLTLPPPQLQDRSGVGMTVLEVGFKGKDFLVMKREEFPLVEVRPVRRVEGMTGLYYRVVDGEGRVLFENMVSDPRVLYWDTLTDGRQLTGGRLDDAEQPVQLRLPFNVMGTLEVYLVSRPEWSRANLSKEARLVGTYRL